jgi:hypothetical protein
MVMSAANIFIQGNARKTIRLVSLTWIITKLICYKLWLGDRLFPIVPVHESLSILPSMTHLLLFITSICGMLWLFFYPNKKVAVVLLLAELLSCMLDQNRWQPWEYQFIFMLVVYISFEDEKQVITLWQLILSGIFFFSGISKFNSAFIHDIWQGMMLQRWLGMNHINSWVIRAGYALPLIEMTAGICLLFGKTRVLAIWTLTCMHVIILWMLGPLGLNINAVIWPWNILMPLLLFSLFYKKSFGSNNSFLWKPVSWLVLLCFWILPWFQLAGYWDKYLSAVLYSGGVEQLFICTKDPAAKKQLAVYMYPSFKVIPCSPVLSVYIWGITEMKTAPYPEKRIYTAIINAWKKRYPDNNDKFYLYKSGFSYSVKEVVLP